MQQLRPGDLVRARHARWQVAAIRPYDGCQMVTLSPASQSAGHLPRRLLTPFDVIERVERSSRLRPVSVRRWRHRCRHLLAAASPPGSLRSARHARMDLLPHQLEPALAVLQGRSCRVLLADEVGLGKTVQAGLISAELSERGWAERILILTPAGLRDQWAAELHERFALTSVIVDAVEGRRIAAALPIGGNPWAVTPVAIASIDYVKRPEVLPALCACRWDIVIVDEAHNVTSDSDRYAAVALLGRRAAYVLLLTATPHSGDRRAFASLCGIGALDDDPILVFRRSRRDVGLGLPRRIHRLHVRPSAAEARMHAMLARFARAVRQEHGENAALNLSVLQKRALSSAYSLEQSVRRRLNALGDTGADGLTACQFALPLDDGGGNLNPDDEPPPWNAAIGLADRERERRLLRDVGDAARAASIGETKIRALRRMLRRVREPALIFTEYRDTLMHLHDGLSQRAAVLHGGLDRAERASVLADFAAGRCQVLLATDAAGEGLNLHHTCRLVINLELPWNPMRLEQRIGRVDRIGQRRTVHVVHLIARHTGEPQLLVRLKQRIASARLDIAAADPLEDSALPALPALPAPPALPAQAITEARRLAEARQCPGESDGTAWAEGPWLMRTRRRVTRERLQGSTILIFLAAFEDGWGRLVEWTLIPTALKMSAEHLRQIDLDLGREVEHAAEHWRDETQRLVEAFTACRLRRERAITAGAIRHLVPELQPGLFDRRAEAAFESLIEAGRGEDVRQQNRIACLEQAARLSFLTRLLLVIAP